MGTRQCEAKNEILRSTTSNQAYLVLSNCVYGFLSPDMATSCWRSGFWWDDLPNRSVLVDLGGGIGAQSILVAEAYPHVHMHVVVEDLDRTQVVSTTVSLPPFLSVRPSCSVAVVGMVPLTTSLVCGGPRRLKVNTQNSSSRTSYPGARATSSTPDPPRARTRRRARSVPPVHVARHARLEGPRL